MTVNTRPGMQFGFILLVLSIIGFPVLSDAVPPSDAIGAKSMPFSELLSIKSSHEGGPQPISPTPAELLPFSEDESLDTGTSDLPPIIKPSHEEIKQKVFQELKELEKIGDAKSKVSFDLPIVINEQVEYFIDYFQTKLRNRFALWMSRSSRYIPMMKKILSDQGLPEDLVYLAMIESGFSTKAYSRAHAAGPWQFIRETGERYGLRVSSWVDERKDPVKSTKAAARHLSDLFNRFGSWYLAAAGYNAGEGKISRALNMYNAQNYWEITADHCRYIKEETKQYVPKMIAAALIAKEPEKYGFNSIPYQNPLAYDEVAVPGGVELKDVASILGVNVETIVELNPELKRWITPPSSSEYLLRIPQGSRAKVMENYAQLIKPKPVIHYAEHRVKKGERLPGIARKYGVKPTLIAKVNRLKSKDRLQPGLILLIPEKKGGTATDIDLIEQENQYEKVASLRTVQGKKEKKAALNNDKDNDKENNLQKIRYTVKKGDSLSSIAQKFDLEVVMIKKWNPKGGKKVLSGSTITLFVNKENSEKEVKKEKPAKSGSKKVKAEPTEKIKLVQYTVKKGDNLTEIAKRFDTTPEKIKLTNKLTSKRAIRPGDKLSFKVSPTSL
jgi:membrane-bound lytic murein transglycosylase D